MVKQTYYSDLSELSIYLFHKVLETNDPTHLIKEQGAEPMEESELAELWSNLYSDYCKLCEDNKSLLYFSVASELLYLETRFQVVQLLLNQIVACLGIPEAVELYIIELRQWGYKIDKTKSLSGELSRMYTQLKQSQNKITLKRNELDTFKSDEEEPMTLTQQVVKLEQALGRNEIDPKKTSVEKWVMLMKEVKEISDARKKINNGRK